MQPLCAPRSKDKKKAKTDTLQVQTGDIVDRGPDTQKLYRWMRNLTEQAEIQGGKVVKLWGYVNKSALTWLRLTRGLAITNS
jgi:hypothetical protein